MTGADEQKRRGGPLAMLAMLALVWICGRVLLWESPFAANPLSLPGDVFDLAESEPSAPPSAWSGPTLLEEGLAATQNSPSQPMALAGSSESVTPPWFERGDLERPDFGTVYSMDPQIAAGHQLLWAAALAHMPMPLAVENALKPSREPAASFAGTENPALPPAPAAGSKDHWSLDSWGFWREGSNASAISQGRVPIYGASQVGASLRYRLLPGSRRDPLLYGRAYRALVDNGETEVAAGVAIRPLPRLPVRVFAELRYTDNAFGRQLRPAAFAVTELPAVGLPFGLSAEAYGQAGYVGGDDPTPFADGQVIVSRELAKFDLASVAPARVSVGAGAWGGAQNDAERLDLGPSVRLDLTLGRTPARVSVDWREHVAGDAAPGSGLAATLSTRF